MGPLEGNAPKEHVVGNYVSYGEQIGGHERYMGLKQFFFSI
jgi:hypothetical protein